MTTWYDEVFRDEERYGLAVARTLHSVRSTFQHVEIIETPAMGKVLVIDGVFMTSQRDEHYYHEMLVHPAMVTAPKLARVLIIGGGDGGTAKRVLQHADVEHVVMVEIDGAVVEACKQHLPGLGAWDDPHLELIIGDGIAYAKRTDIAPFDVVFLDGTDPVGPGEGLFNRDFYASVQRLLTPGGVFALQSESPYLHRALFIEIQEALAKHFTQVRPYFGPAPLYSAGVWSWTYATNAADADPRAPLSGRVESIEAHCRYYNADIHRSAFAVPTDLRPAIGLALGERRAQPR